MITAKKTFSSKSQVININSINLFLLIPYHFQISLSSPTATSRLHKLIIFLGSARRINRLLLVTTNRQKTGPQKKMAATMKRAGKATIDCHFRLRLAGSFFPAQPWELMFCGSRLSVISFLRILSAQLNAKLITLNRLF